MAKVAVITDTGSGITKSLADDMGLPLVQIPFMFGESEEVYYEEINLSREEFFQRLKAGEKVHTSQPSPADVMKIWDEALEKNDSVVYIPMSSGLSGSCQSAMMLAQDYGGRVQVVNNQRISVTQKASVMDAIALAEKGWDAVQIKEKLEAVKFDSSIYIMLDTLEYLKRGGRITPAAAAIGTLLRLKPVLQIKGERLDAFSKARTAAQGKNTMITTMKSDIDTLYGGFDAGDVNLYCVQAECPAEVAVFRQEMDAAFPHIPIADDKLALVICCHIGPGALALACSRKVHEGGYELK